ncbi:hypothetical protein AVEN_242457-1 [Araneus ventricosus]|uniref:Uncharacterized protein n=1 Tax=Araneus ventricosus TaxID=182803 RepID=A0A4Y2J5L8_ARAVE|nr:hypothetical protein AVEN_242457-1 [Araneus ventricosus]
MKPSFEATLKVFPMCIHGEKNMEEHRTRNGIFDLLDHLEQGADDDDVEHEVLQWMRHQPKQFYAAGIGALIKRWDKCINTGGDYVEK